MAHPWLQTISGVILPCPAYGSNGLTISTIVDGGRNTKATFVGSVIGDDKLSIDVLFSALSPESMRNFLVMFDRTQGGKFVNDFIVFDPRHNDWVQKKMYVGDRTGRPLLLDSQTGKPTKWLDVKTKLVEV